MSVVNNIKDSNFTGCIIVIKNTLHSTANEERIDYINEAEQPKMELPTSTDNGRTNFYQGSIHDESTKNRTAQGQQATNNIL